jgi:predicted lipid-binding transport protein (Tim44 family)
VLFVPIHIESPTVFLKVEDVMKQLIAMLSLVTFLFTVSFDAFAAKKFGSKKQSGKTQETQTAQPKQQVDTKTLPANTAPAKSSKKGIMAGVLGGLLAGGLIAAMLGDDFEGFQWLEMIMLALAAFVIFKLVKGMLARKQQPTYAGSAPYGNQSHQTYQQPTAQPSQPQAFTPAANSFGTAGSSVPFTLPRDFDLNGFLRGAENHYRTVQTAWNENDLAKVSEYLSPELIEEFKAERQEQGQVNNEVLFLSAEAVRADVSPLVWEISVMFRGKYRDHVENVEEPIHEIWHLERKTDANAPWLIVGVENLAAE